MAKINREKLDVAETASGKSFLELIDDMDVPESSEVVTQHVHAAHAHVERDMRGEFTDALSALKFMRAGNATVTLRSRRTGTRFTYRLRLSDDGACLFVGLLTGAGNESAYSYLGRISRDVFWAGRKVPRVGDVGKDAPSSQAFAWTWRQLVNGNMPSQLEVWHEGQCGRCGRKLTVPSSIAAGFGPECAGKV